LLAEQQVSEVVAQLQQQYGKRRAVVSGRLWRVVEAAAGIAVAFFTRWSTWFLEAAGTLLCVFADAGLAPLSKQGKACNVSKASDVRALADYAQQQLGTIDLW
jgi:hypothetical protein